MKNDLHMRKSMRYPWSWLQISAWLLAATNTCTAPQPQPATIAILFWYKWPTCLPQHFFPSFVWLLPINVITSTLRPPNSPFPCLNRFDKHDRSPAYHIQINSHFHPFSGKAIFFIATKQRTVVTGLKFCENKCPLSDAAQASLSFLVLITRDANLQHL